MAEIVPMNSLHPSTGSNTEHHDLESALPPLRQGEQLLNEYIAPCPECGQICFYRWYISTRKVVRQIKTPCECTEKYQNQECAAAVKNQIISLFGSRNMLEQKAYRRMQFKTYQPQNKSQQSAFEYMQSWTVEHGSVVLAGLPGRGKTHLAMSVAFEMQKKGQTVLAIKVIDLLNMLRRSYDKGNGQDIEILDTLKQVDLLVMDDIGAEKGTEWALEKLYEIVDARYGLLPTIYTTNLTPENLGKKLTSAIASRVYGSEKVLLLDGPDYRMKNDEWGGIGQDVFR